MKKTIIIRTQLNAQYTKNTISIKGIFNFVSSIALNGVHYVAE